mgnify:FL=1
MPRLTRREVLIILASVISAGIPIASYPYFTKTEEDIKKIINQYQIQQNKLLRHHAEGILTNKVMLHTESTRKIGEAISVDTSEGDGLINRNYVLTASLGGTYI